MNDTAVLIIGGGPVGLSMALALARQNIPSVVIEKHPSTTNHPKARGVRQRTMELFRQWGIDKALIPYELPTDALRFIWAESLQGEEITRVNLHAGETEEYSPASASLVSQDRVEEALYDVLLKYPETAVQFSKECLGIDETDAGISARVLNRNTNQEERFTAQYAVVAEGAHSRATN